MRDILKFIWAFILVSAIILTPFLIANFIIWLITPIMTEVALTVFSIIFGFGIYIIYRMSK